MEFRTFAHKKKIVASKMVGTETGNHDKVGQRVIVFSEFRLKNIIKPGLGRRLSITFDT